MRCLFAPLAALTAALLPAPAQEPGPQLNMIVVKGEAARLIKETTSHGNDYLSEAKVVISAQ